MDQSGQAIPKGDPPVLYTTYSSGQKGLITALLGLTTLASPLTATIYFPLLPLLQKHFRTSAQAINLTMTIYLVVQALSPTIFASLSDSLGRRLIYLTTFTLYALANLGLALNKNSYAALLVLRVLQSICASSVVSIAYGVVADVCVPAERGRMLGPVMAATNLGACIGPVIGGWVAVGSRGYEWVFWCLVIFGALLIGAIGFGLPETSRKVVGNGSIKAIGWERTWWSVAMGYLRGWRKQRRSEENRDVENVQSAERAAGNSATSKRPKVMIGNPLACLRLIFWKDTALILWMGASPYTVWYCIQTSIPLIYKDIYNFNEIKTGLSYLPGGAGVVLGGYLNGKLMDYCYKKTAKEISRPIDDIAGDNLTDFPIEKARARACWYFLAISTITLSGYGWAVKHGAHVSIPLILQFILGFICTSILHSFMALLIDVFPENPSTASAAGNVTRSALAAAGVAVLQPLVDIMGRGWYFTLLSAISGVAGAAAVWAVQTRGMKWRGQRVAMTTTASRGGGDLGESGRGHRLEISNINDGVKATPSAALAATLAGHGKKEEKI